MRKGASRSSRIRKGIKYQYSYDTNGNLATVTYPALPQQAAPQYAYSYDTTHRLTGGTDPDGNLLPTTVYDASGRLQSVSETVLDYLGNPSTYTTSYSYNTATNTTTITYPADANGNVGTATMVYDSYGMLLSSTDPLNHKTTNLRSLVLHGWRRPPTICSVVTGRRFRNDFVVPALHDARASPHHLDDA